MADVNKFIDELTAGTVTAGDETVVLRGGAAGTEYRVPLGTMAAQAANAVAITGGTAGGFTSFGVRSTGAAFDLKLANAEVLTAARTLTLALGDAARTLTMTGDATLNQDVSTAGGPAFANITDSGITAGSVVFAGTAGLLSQDNARLFWNNTTHRLGLGTASPAPNSGWAGTNNVTLHIKDQTTNLPNLRFQSTNMDFTFACDNSNASFYLASNGGMVFQTNAQVWLRKFTTGASGGIAIGPDFSSTPGNNTIAASNGTSPMKLQLYNTYSSSGANYERLNIDWATTANLCRIDVTAAGTGTQRNMALVAGGGRLLVGTTTDDGATAVQVSGSMSVSGVLTANGGITMGDADNIVVNATTGTKIGTATTQKLGFWNATPIVQPTGIVDADGTLADITTKFNSLLGKLESFGMLAVA